MTYPTTNLSANGNPTRPVIDTEVTPKAKRRSFTKAYKQRILKEAAACRENCQVGALLRREGLYASHLSDWRRQQGAGQLAGSTSRQRGRPTRQTAQQKEIARLQRENERLRQQLEQAGLIIAAQKKLAQALEQTLSQPSETSA